MADSLAKKALNNNLIHIIIKRKKIKITYKYIIHFGRLDGTLPPMADFMIAYTPQVIKQHSSLPRRTEIIYHRLLLGRAWLGDTRYRFHLLLTDLCQHCNSREDMYHLIFIFVYHFIFVTFSWVKYILHHCMSENPIF